MKNTIDEDVKYWYALGGVNVDQELHNIATIDLQQAQQAEIEFLDIYNGTLINE